MDCSQASDLMSAVALGDLRGPELADFERHLSMCPSCRAEFTRARETLRLLTDGACAAVPEGVLDLVLAAGRAELARRPGRRLLRVAVSVAAAGIALLLGLWSWREPPDRIVPGADCLCWRFVGRDPGNSRLVDTSAVRVPERVLWGQKIESGAACCKPLAWKDLVIIGTRPTHLSRRGGALVAFDARDGRVRWRRSFASGDLYKAKGFPDRCIQDGRFYLTDGDRCLVFEAATGRELAAFEPPEEAIGWGYLTAFGSRLYGAARDGRTVFCLDATSGRPLWSRPAGGAVFVPALSDGRLYLHTDTGVVAALEASSGGRIWRRNSVTGGGRGSVHARDDRVLILTERGEVVALDGMTGRTAWKRAVHGAFYSGLALGRDSVHLLAGTLALEVTSGRILWRQHGRFHGICSAPTLAGGHILAAAGRELGSLSVFDRSGKLVRTIDNAALWACDGAIVSGGRVYTVGGGRLVALSCGTGG